MCVVWRQIIPLLAYLCASGNLCAHASLDASPAVARPAAKTILIQGLPLPLLTIYHTCCAPCLHGILIHRTQWAALVPMGPMW